MYRIVNLPHTADIRLHLEADSLEELLLAGLKGMGNLLKENFCGRIHADKRQFQIETTGEDLTTTFINFLSAVLTKSYIEKMVFCEAEVFLFDGHRIKAVLYGTKVDGFDEDIKAVTYHEANISRTASGKWATTVIFDI